MMAALQVQEALKLLHGMPVAAGTALVFNGVANQFYSTQLAVPRRLPEPRDLSRSRSSCRWATASTVARAFRGGRGRSWRGRFAWCWTASWSSRSTARGARGAAR